MLGECRLMAELPSHVEQRRQQAGTIPQKVFQGRPVLQPFDHVTVGARAGEMGAQSVKPFLGLNPDWLI